MWVNFNNRSRGNEIKDINTTIRELSNNVYYVITGISSTGVNFYYRNEIRPFYATSYRHCYKYNDLETAKRDAKMLKDSNNEFFRVIDPTTLRILEIAENVIVTKTVKM